MSQWGQERDGVLCMALVLPGSGMDVLLAPGSLLQGCTGRTELGWAEALPWLQQAPMVPLAVIPALTNASIEGSSLIKKMGLCYCTVDVPRHMCWKQGCGAVIAAGASGCRLGLPILVFHLHFVLVLYSSVLRSPWRG